MSSLKDSDIVGPIKNSMFFKHKLHRNIREDYEIGKEIGSGAYGSVRLVTHKKTGIVRAAKWLRKKVVTE